MRKEGKKILILGSSGKIGRDLYELFKPNFNVVGTYLSRKDSRLGDYKLDLLNIHSFKKIIEKVHPNFVINATGIASPEKCRKGKRRAYLTNYKTAENVAMVCGKKKISFVYFSTDYIFAGDKKNYLEEDIPNPLNYYGMTKLLGEIISREGIILRFPKVMFLNKFRDPFFREIIRKDVLQLDNFRIRKILWTYDLYKVIKRIFRSNIKKGIYHVCGDEVLTKYQLAKLFLDSQDLNKRIRPVKDKEAAPRPKMSVMTNRKIKKLAIKFTPLKTIFRSKKFNINENI